MDRSFLRYGYRPFAVVLISAWLSVASGCTSLLSTVLWVTGADRIPAKFDGLREKRVAVVCRPVAALTYGRSHVAKDLARQVGRRLRANVRKIEVIEHRKVAEWLDESPSDDYEYVELADALEADMVVVIELKNFDILQGQTLYQGKADVDLAVYDCTEGSKMVYEEELPQSVYPPISGVETSAKPESEFRREYLHVLAEQIGRYFYPHDPRADFAMDARALR